MPLLYCLPKYKTEPYITPHNVFQLTVNKLWPSRPVASVDLFVSCQQDNSVWCILKWWYLHRGQGKQCSEQPFVTAHHMEESKSSFFKVPWRDQLMDTPDAPEIVCTIITLNDLAGMMQITFINLLQEHTRWKTDRQHHSCFLISNRVKYFKSIIMSCPF